MLGTECENFRVMMRRVTAEPAASPHRHLHPDTLRDLVLHPGGCPPCLAWAEDHAAGVSGSGGPSPALDAALDELTALESYWNWKASAKPDKDDLCAVWRDTMRRFGQPDVAERALEMKGVLGPHLMGGCDACETFKPTSEAHLEAHADAFLTFIGEMMTSAIDALVDDDDDDDDDAHQRGTD